MVILYGTNTTSYVDGISGRRNNYLSPSLSLLKVISELPKGSTVAMEGFSNEDWGKVKENDENIIDKALEDNSDYFHNITNNDGEIEFTENIDPYYMKLSMSHLPCRGNDFWNELNSIVKTNEHEILFLDSIQTWKEISQKKISSMDKSEKALLTDDSVDELTDHYLKVIRAEESLNEVIEYNRLIKHQRIFDLIEKIKQSNVDLVVGNLGLTSVWYDLKEKLNFQIDEYFEDENSPTLFEIESGLTEKHTTYSSPFKGLERAIDYMKFGRFDEHKNPDFRFYWSVFGTSDYGEGYIENKNANKIQGRMVDYLGDAEFEGVIENNKIEIVKNYINIFSGGNLSPLKYTLEKTDSGMFRGTYAPLKALDHKNNIILSMNPKHRKMDLSLNYHKDHISSQKISEEIMIRAKKLHLV